MTYPQVSGVPDTGQVSTYLTADFSGRPIPVQRFLFGTDNTSMETKQFRRGHPNSPTKSPRQQTRRAASIFKLRWPSGLRRWIKAPVVSAARVRISLLTFLKCYSLCLHKRTVSVVYHEEKCNAVVREDLFQGKTGYLPRASS